MESTYFPVLGPIPAIIPIYVGGIAVLLYLSYRWALVKPIPGIPFNESAANTILGDVPDFMKWIKRTSQTYTWISHQNVKLNSPIVQVFVRPFSKPWVVISDFRETQDICLRRTKEFDRSNFFGDVFVGVIPNHHIDKSSKDPAFKRNRNLVNHLMAPAFLKNVLSPQIYTSVNTIIDFWKVKMILAKGHPFEADPDIFHGALDVIFAAAFGLTKDDSVIFAQKGFLESQGNVVLPKDIEEPAVFTHAALPTNFEAILTLTESLEISIKAPLPRLAHTVLRQFPYMKRAMAAKEDLIKKEIAKAVEVFSKSNREPESALEEIIFRESLAAKKDGRQPDYFQRPIIDETFGFLIGGHDTTSSTVCWGVKRLSDNPKVQTTLRNMLRQSYPDATASRRNPTAEEINKVHIPYLEAVIEEIVRLSKTASGVMRKALVDTTVLGHPIPKGTDVFMMGIGPGYESAPFEISDSLRSPSSLAAKGRQVGSWEPSDMLNFRPERWLTTENGEEVYNSMAGPVLLFGAGPRGCYGKKLAYMEMRMIVVMLIWNFVLGKCSEGLSSYDSTDKLTGQPKQCYVKLSEVEW